MCSEHCLWCQRHSGGVRADKHFLLVLVSVSGVATERVALFFGGDVFDVSGWLLLSACVSGVLRGNIHVTFLWLGVIRSTCSCTFNSIAELPQKHVAPVIGMMCQA